MSSSLAITNTSLHSDDIELLSDNDNPYIQRPSQYKLCHDIVLTKL